ncbi:MAG TPA: cysteine desulfurase family protein [Candidatus Acidoferrum sp.]|nr:cysteine desulfurase family protein [Candidatus Acidoferrum sp.]
MIENVKELLKAHENLKREVYLDNENSSIVPNEVIKAMIPYYNRRGFGNPTLTHKPGWEAFETIMESTQMVASFLGCGTLENINFTPGETEADNLALMGTVLSKSAKGGKIVISEVEPLGVLNVAEMLQKRGFTLTKIPVDVEGLINLEKLKEAVDKETILVSLSTVNHEIGTIQPIKEAVKLVKDENPETIFHTDASDAYGKVPFNVQNLDLDLATVSSYKILGPRGIGVLYVKEHVNVERILEGQIGTQRLWPGLENTPLIVGFAKASELAFDNFEENAAYMQKLRDRLIDRITREIPEVLLNGPVGEKRAPDNVNISFLRCEGEALTIELSLNGVYASSGSACSRRLLQPSHVLVAIGRKFDQAHGSILMKITRMHTEEDISYALKVIPKAVQRIRGITGSTGAQ